MKEADPRSACEPPVLGEDNVADDAGWASGTPWGGRAVWDSRDGGGPWMETNEVSRPGLCSAEFSACFVRRRETWQQHQSRPEKRNASDGMSGDGKVADKISAGNDRFKSSSICT